MIKYDKVSVPLWAKQPSIAQETTIIAHAAPSWIQFAVIQYDYTLQRWNMLGIAPGCLFIAPASLELMLNPPDTSTLDLDILLFAFMPPLTLDIRMANGVFFWGYISLNVKVAIHTIDPETPAPFPPASARNYTYPHRRRKPRCS